MPKADHERDELDAVEELALPEGEARHSLHRVEADERDQHAEHRDHQRLEDRPPGEPDADREAHDDEEELGQPELERQGSEGRGEEHEADGRHRAAEEQAERRDASPPRRDFAISCPSIMVITDDASPGTLRRTVLMVPPYCEP